MSQKNKSLVILIIIFTLVTALGGYYTLSVQQKKMNKKDKKLEKLRANYSSAQALDLKLKEAEKKVAIVDSLLFSGKFSIPKNLPQSKFYDFVDKYCRDYGLYTFTNTEFVNENVENGFNYYTYKVSGVGAFNNVYGLVYAIEHSKELKKINSAEVSGNTSVDDRGVQHYLVKFNFEVRTYFSYSDQYTAVNDKENNLLVNNLYNSFYPLVRTNIRPNVSNLPDIQDAALISLVPQGAFISDSKGETHLMKKGDRVYLGYLTDIDYDNEEVTFILNKGGIIEYQTLKMGRTHKNRK